MINRIKRNKIKYLFSGFSFLVMMIFSCNKNPSLAIESMEIPHLFVAQYTSTPPEINGVIEAEIWDEIAWSSTFIDIEGVLKPKYDTRMKMLWDEQNLYILAQLEEPHIWGNLKQRDTVIFYNNDFEVFIDPNGDTHQYIELEINALNTVWDLFLEKPYRNNVIVDNEWNIEGLQSAVAVEGTINDPSDIDKYWNIEIALPWEGLKRGNTEVQIPRNSFWRINFSRVNWDFNLKNNSYQRKKDEKGKFLKEYNWVWSPQYVINMHEPERWGYVFFAENTTAQRDIELPEDAHLLQWMYAQYRKKLSLARQNNDDDTPVSTFWKGKKVMFEKQTLQDTVYWVTTNPKTEVVYQIRYDGKLLIQKE